MKTLNKEHLQSLLGNIGTIDLERGWVSFDPEWRISPKFDEDNIPLTILLFGEIISRILYERGLVLFHRCFRGFSASPILEPDGWRSQFTNAWDFLNRSIWPAAESNPQCIVFENDDLYRVVPYLALQTHFARGTPDDIFGLTLDGTVAFSSIHFEGVELQFSTLNLFEETIRLFESYEIQFTSSPR